MSLIFCFFSQYKATDLNSPKGCCVWILTRDVSCILRFGGHTRGSVFSMCPYQKYFRFSRAVNCSHEQYNQTKTGFPQSKRLCSKSKSLFTVVIGLLSIWFWPYLPSYSSLSSLPIVFGLLTAQICAWPLSSVVRRHLCATFWPFLYLLCPCCIFLSL